MNLKYGNDLFHNNASGPAWVTLYLPSQFKIQDECTKKWRSGVYLAIGLWTNFISWVMWNGFKMKWALIIWVFGWLRIVFSKSLSGIKEVVDVVRCEIELKHLELVEKIVVNKPIKYNHIIEMFHRPLMTHALTWLSWAWHSLHCTWVGVYPRGTL